MNVRSVGVEEELLLIDPSSGVPRAIAGGVIRFARENGDEGDDARDDDRDDGGDDDWHDGGDDGGDVEPLEAEFQREQLETATRPCLSLEELAEQIHAARRAASDAAHGLGAEIAALATSPVAVSPSVTPSSRYLRMARAYGKTAEEQLTCGCHVHVSVESPDEGVGVLDRIRPWLPPLLALTANSPFWQDQDTGYASFRQQLWSRWPSAGPTGLFESVKAYRDTVEDMVRSGGLLDEGMVYFDARLSRNYPTVEIRVADVCLLADDAVLLAALARALAETAALGWRAGELPDPVRPEVLRLAMWRASRSGLQGELLHPVTQRPAPAHDVLSALVDHVTPALEQAGDLHAVRELLGGLLRRGTGADLQHAVRQRGGEMTEVVQSAVSRTLGF
ncbi:glutamate--cysteine ligase [Actinomadura sp. HBU206391]|uniref:carboxylate-amine ligase n=1 Tax=Actinomadura sp. HBU206391 TaxID=2731692 RepID=UPI00164F54D7|nr:glutamate--cysteine ligase [Actinomadura sp. HBU206391]MBC6457263.1 glutamate--cysteine ligase [Actinomadura sp. HBU206391]